MWSSLPPFTGVIARVPNFIPGTFTSMPNTAVPFTLDGVSRRLALVPISLNWLGFFSGMGCGTGWARGVGGNIAVAERSAGGVVV